MTVCMACTYPTGRPWHDRCPGSIHPGNRVNLPQVPCGCTDPAHRDGSTTHPSTNDRKGSTVRP